MPTRASLSRRLTGIQFFERAQLQGSKLNLESFLIMPVQRMPRYILLMRDMLKYTHAHHPDKDLLERALEAVSATMTRHNKEIDPKASDHAHKLLAVAGSITNVDALQQEKGITGGVCDELHTPAALSRLLTPVPGPGSSETTMGQGR